MTPTAECPTCRATMPGTFEEPMMGVSPDVDIDLVPCEGSAEKHELCHSCRKECWLCGLYCCEEHSRVIGENRICNVCRDAMVEEDAAELGSGHGSEVKQD